MDISDHKQKVFLSRKWEYLKLIRKELYDERFQENVKKVNTRKAICLIKFINSVKLVSLYFSHKKSIMVFERWFKSFNRRRGDL